MSRVRREMSASVRSIAHETIVVAKMTIAAVIAVIIAVYCGRLWSITTGAISAPNVKNRPSARAMSAVVVSTDSLRVYSLLGAVGLA